MDVGMAHAIETAESEYLCSRVESLSRISGNPFGARVFFNEAFPCFQVKASPSPMSLKLMDRWFQERFLVGKITCLPHNLVVCVHPR